MLQINRILFPTDGSPCAEQARERAVHLAERYDAELHVLHVVEERTNTLDNLSELVEIREEDILADLRIPIPQAEEERIQKETVTHPSAAGGILEYADAHDIDLIVMGTHGRRGVERLLMGSVAEEVVRLAECPVFTVCATRHAEGTGGSILVPVDFSEHTDTLIQHAMALAEAFDAGLDLLHVVEEVRTPAVYGVESRRLDLDTVKQRTRAALDDYAAAAREQGIAADVHVRMGHPAHAILRFIDEQGVQMVTIATHGRTGLQRLLMGSVAEKVVRMASCPVFTVKSYGKSILHPDG